MPESVLGVLTVRGQILPVIDLRRLLSQKSLADEFRQSCGPAAGGIFAVDRATRHKVFAGSVPSKVDSPVVDWLRKWIAESSFSSQQLMELLGNARSLNEGVAKQILLRAGDAGRGDGETARAHGEEVLPSARATVESLRRFESQVAQHIQEDQRIIVVDAEGLVLGLVVDHVHELLNVPSSLVETVPQIASGAGTELSGVAKLDDGSALSCCSR